MFNGPGKYDDLVTLVREQTEAEGVILIVHRGKLGDGFSVQAPIDVLLALPDLLRDLARQIEQQIEAGKARGGR